MCKGTYKFHNSILNSYICSVEVPEEAVKKELSVEDKRFLREKISHPFNKKGFKKIKLEEPLFMQRLENKLGDKTHEVLKNWCKNGASMSKGRPKV